MVSAPAVADAIARAKSLPTLNVGLHLVLANGKPCLPAEKIPDLLNAQGEFPSNQVASGIKIFFLAKVRRQIEAEIRAQFEAFKQTGLRLDHVNTHKHMHLHPTVLEMIIRIGKDYDVKAIRLPNEPLLDALINDRKEKIRRHAQRLFLKPWVTRMKKRLQENGIRNNEYIYGIYDSGHMHIETVIRILAHLPDGLTEIYSHPATERWDDIDPAANDYEFEAEYKALIHNRTKQAIDKFSIELTGFNRVS